MPCIHMDKYLLVEYLNCRRLPIAQCEGAAHLHSAICEVAPDFYLSLLADPVTEASHKREILLNFLSHPAARECSRQRILTQLYALPVSEALQVIEVIRDQRINRSRARELVLAFLLGHEQFPMLAATKKQRVIRLLKHAMGERTWSSTRRFLAETGEDGEIFLQRELLHYAWNGDAARVREVLSFLSGIEFSPHESILAKSLAARQNLEQGEGLPKETLLGLRGVYHKKIPVKKIHYLSAVDSTSIRTDGPLTVLYKETFFEQAKSGTPVATTTPPVPESVRREGPFAVLYQAFAHLFQPETDEPSPGHKGAGSDAQAHTLLIAEQNLSDRLARAIESVPLIQGRLAIVLDLSASMVSSGERHKLKTVRNVVNLEGLLDLEDLKQRLAEKRQQEEAERVNLMQAASNFAWEYSAEAQTQEGLRVIQLEQGEWVGQMVKDGANMVYLSAFRDVVD
jgi:hypothetical protein